MEISKKIYPHPVLASFSHCYETSSFEAVFSAECFSDDSLKINASFSLNNSILSQMLSEKKVCFGLHCECPSTGYRQIVRSTANIIEVIIPSKLISEKIQLCPLLIANEKLTNYSNPDFVSALRGISFNNIEKGMILAVSDSYNVPVIKNKLDFSQTPSIIEFVQNLNKDEKNVQLEMTGQKLVLRIPYDVFPYIRNNERNIAIQPLINSVLIVPALVSVLEKIDKSENHEEFETLRWFMALKKALFEKFKIDLDQGNKIEENGGGILNVAQTLIGSPVIEGLTYSEKHIGENIDD